MKFTLNENYNNFRYPEDIKAIRSFLESKGNLNATNREIEELWEDFSDTWCASWLGVHEETLIDFFNYFCDRFDIDTEEEEDYDGD